MCAGNKKYTNICKGVSNSLCSGIKQLTVMIKKTEKTALNLKSAESMG